MGYEDKDSKAGYGPVEKRGSEIELHHPAPDIDTLIQQTHLEAQLHEWSHDKWDDIASEPNDGSILHDRKIIEVMEQVMGIEGNQIKDLDIPERRLKAIFVTSAREISKYSAIYRYLKDSPKVCAEIGYDSPEDIPSPDTFQKEIEQRLPEELDGGIDALYRARIRAVYAVYRNGIEPPAKVKTVYGFDVLAPPLNEDEVDRWVEQQAILNWIRVLARRTLKPLTFGRTDPEFDLYQYLGVFAASAAHSAGFQTIPDISDWHLAPPSISLDPGTSKRVDIDRSAIPKGSGLWKHIANLPLRPEQASRQDTDVPSIMTQFNAVHRNFFTVAQERNFFESQSYPIASDIFRIEWTGSDKAPTIDRPAKSENDVRSEWTFAVASILDKGARFTFGTRFLPTKSEYPEKLGEMLPIAEDFIETEALYADSEIVGGDLIDTVQSHTKPNFYIKAPDKKRVKALKALTPRNHVGFVPNISWNCDEKPNLVAYPDNCSDPSRITFSPRQIDAVVESDWPKSSELPGSSKSLDEYTDESDSDGDPFPPSVGEKFESLESRPGVGQVSNMTAYLTGCVPGESPSRPKFTRRWGVEENINQISNDFLPLIESSKPELRVYGVNIAILFQNWHTLINRAPSPQLGLRLSITHSELLTAIQKLAFSDSAM